MSTRETIIARIMEIAEQQNRKLAPLTDDLRLVDSGLNSLCLAILVATLEDALGRDPFSDEDGAEFPVTLGDFIKLYEHATV
jgi:acyl carrier protein